MGRGSEGEKRGEGSESREKVGEEMCVEMVRRGIERRVWRRRSYSVHKEGEGGGRRRGKSVGRGN